MKAQDAEGAPPSYNSLFGELQQQRSQSSGVVDYAKNATGVCCGKIAGAGALTIGIICCIGLGLALPIAEIVIGAKYLKDCPVERYLPIYLIVAGSFGILSSCTSGGQKASKHRKGDSEDEGSTKSAVGTCCNSLIGVFLMAWFICGNVWVFKLKKCGPEVDVPNSFGCFTTDPSYSNTTVYCNDTLYQFVYWDTLAKWIVCAVAMVLSCLCCCVMCCAYCCSSGRNEDER